MCIFIYAIQFKKTPGDGRKRIVFAHLFPPPKISVGTHTLVLNIEPGVDILVITPLVL